MSMSRFRASPALWITYSICLVLLIGLGSWQARKVGPKTDLLTRIEIGLNAAPIALPEEPTGMQAAEYQRVYFSGTVMEADAARIFGTNLAGKAGYHLYLPVLRPEGGPVVVNFGWIPFDYTGSVALPVGEQVTIEGVIRATSRAGRFTPENNPADNIWYHADVPALAAHFGLEDAAPYRIARDAVGTISTVNEVTGTAGAAKALVPLGGQTIVNIPNNHLNYAFTWFGLAVALTGVFILYGMTRQT